MNKYLWYKKYQINKLLRKVDQNKSLLLFISYIVVAISLTSNNYILFIPIGFILIILKTNSRLLLTASLLLSAAIVLNSTTSINKEINLNLGKDVEIQATVFEDPDIKDFNQQLIIKVDGLQGGIIAKADKYPKLFPGDKLMIKGVLEAPQNFSEDFDYIGYLKSKKVFYIFEGEVMKLENENNLFNTIMTFKNRLLDISNKYINEPEASLFNGIMLGVRSNFSDEFQDNLSGSGLSHIVSVSGFNFTIIYIALLSLAGKFNRKVVYIASGIIIVLFLLLVGTYNLPAMRATIMILLILLGKMVGRKVPIENIVCFVVAAVLFEYPYYWSNISFQLSVAATVGLFVFANYFKFLFKRVHETLQEILSATLAVTLITLPIVFINFGELSLISIISNLLALPIIPALMFLGFIGFVTGMLNINIITHSIFVLVEFILKYINIVITKLGSTPVSKTDSSTLVLSLLIILLFLVIFVDYKKFNNKQKN